MMWDPFEEIDRMRRNMDRMFSEMLSRRRGIGEFREPVVDVINRSREIVVIAELPGVSKEDIIIDCEPTYLVIEAKRKERRGERKEGYIYRERSAMSFRRSMTLPEEVLPEKAKAEFKNGILELTLPKKAVAKVKKGRRIRIE